MSIVEEKLNGGLVLAGDPAFNKPGELSDATNAHYRHDDDGLWRYPGLKNEVTLTTGYAINGITSCRFDSSHWLIAQCNSKYWIADAEADGASFASALAVIEGTPVQAISHTNRWFVLNGAQANQVLKSNGTFRRMGLLAINVAPTIAGTATASAFSASATGYYDYWYTEVFDDGAGVVLESSSNTPLVLSVTTTATAPIIGIGIALNVGITKYRLYRSPAKSTSADAGYPTGQLLAEIPYTGTPVTFIDSSVTSITTSAILPEVETHGTGLSVTATSAGLHLTAVMSATATHSDTNFYALGLTQSPWGISTPVYPKTGQFTIEYKVCKSINGTATAGTDPLLFYIGIGRLRSSDPHKVMMMAPYGKSQAVVTYDIDATTGKLTPYSVGSSTSAPNIYAGTPLSSVFPSEAVHAIVPASLTTVAATATNTVSTGVDFTYLGSGVYTTSVRTLNVLDGDLCCIIFAQFPDTYAGSTVTHSTPTTLLTFDSPDTKVNYLGGALTSGDAYPTTTFEVGVAVDVVSTNSPPPLASIGCVFDGHVVVNDINNLRTIRYSNADEPEYWPSLYGLDLPIKSNDAITALFPTPASNLLLVGTKGSIWAVLSLPTETDASINPGIVMRQISDSHNILSQNCVAQYLSPRGVPEVAFVGTNGVFSTDGGGSFRDLGQDLVWSNNTDSIIGPLDSSIYTKVIGLINDPATQNLKLFVIKNYEVTSSSASSNDTVVYSASYAQRHNKQTGLFGVYGLKWAGPAHVSVASIGSYKTNLACVYNYRRNTGLFVTLHGRGSQTISPSSGTIAREDGEDGIISPASQYSPLPDANNNKIAVTTRDMYLAGFGKQFSVNDAWLYGARLNGTAQITPAGTITTTQRYVNAASASSSGTVSATQTTKFVSLPIGDVNADGVSFAFVGSTADSHVLYSLMLDVNDGGDSKRA